MLFRPLFLLLCLLLAANNSSAQPDGYGPPLRNNATGDERPMPPPNGNGSPKDREAAFKQPRDKNPNHQGRTHQEPRGDGYPPPRQRRQGPPPEAFDACRDALLGQEVQIQTPHGHKIDALCDYVGDDLVAIPLHFFEPEQPK